MRHYFSAPRAVGASISLLGVIVMSVGVLTPVKADEVDGSSDSSSESVVEVLEYLFPTAPAQVTLVGAPNSSAQVVSQMVPSGKSPWWWLLNERRVRAAIQRSRWVRQVHTGSCETDVYPFCVRLKIEERVPKYGVSLDRSLWLVAEDGTFLQETSLSNDQAHYLREEPGLRHLIFVDLTSLGKMATPTLRDIFSQVSMASSILAQEVRRHPFRVTPVPDAGELKVIFDDLPGTVTFSAGLNPVLLRKESRRLKKLLDRFGSRSRLLKEVDVSFDRLAVVSLQE